MVQCSGTTPARSGLVAALVGPLVAAVVLVALPGFADPYDDKQRVDRELARARSTLEAATDRARDAAAAYAEASNDLPKTRGRLAEAKGMVAAAEVAVVRARRNADRARRALGTARAVSRAAESRVSEARDRVSTFVTAAYKGGGAVAFNSMLDARSPSDLADRVAYLDDLARSQRAALDNVISLRHQTREGHNEAVLARRKADAAERKAEDALDTANEARETAVRAARDVVDLVDKRRDALAVARSERDDSLQRYRELQRESERIQDEIRGLADRDRASNRKPKRSGSGAVLEMPTRGWNSSGFGRRWDPYYRVWQVHAGIDFAAPGGQVIRAAADGRVFRAGWNGGYGNYTCVYHGLYQGEGLATCYAHQSAIGVSEGQYVRRGQHIGRVGATGASTGNHLHFEVRRDGAPVDPVPWLPRCLCGD